MLDKAKGNGQYFISEVATLGRIHHVNVVQLIGYCIEGPKHALMYEFMENGFLDKYIFSKPNGIEQSLSLHQLYAISVGVARADDNNNSSSMITSIELGECSSMDEIIEMTEENEKASKLPQESRLYALNLPTKSLSFNE
ncbi:hypothetical protein K1719_043447 [Acacia pycnantha]|nr:hypothetical protein K1719_043447 [Acacia pycnantha]